jgi:type I restriction enzyme, S subunit
MSKGPWEIPASWEWVQICEIADVVGGGTPRTDDRENYDGGDISWITPADLSGYVEKFISRGARNITERGLSSSGARMLPEGTVLFSSRAPIGYVAIAANAVSTNQGFKSFVMPDGVISSFVYWYLKRAKELAIALASGTTFLEVSGRNAALLPLPIPPTVEQQRIVNEIEALVTDLVAAVAALKRVQASLKRYRASVLKAACEGRLVPTEAELARNEGRTYENGGQLLAHILKERRADWEADQLAKMIAAGKPPQNDSWKKKYNEPEPPDTSELPELPDGWAWACAEAIADAVDPQPSHRTPPEVTGGVPYVGMGDVTPERRIDRERARKVSAAVLAEHRERYKLRVGDFFIGKIGTIGKPVCVEEPFDYAISANVVLIQPRQCPLLFWYMSTGAFNRLLAEGSRATTQAAFGIQKMRLLPCPVPPLGEQDRIVQELEGTFSVIDHLEHLVLKELARADRLRQAILKRAFEGKLVPQDPNDEPASVLLERIRAGRAENVTNPRARTRLAGAKS